MEYKKPTVQITKINELPRMYDNWNEFYFWWHPWVLSTGAKEISVVDYGSGVVTEHKIEWCHALIMAHYGDKNPRMNLPSVPQVKMLRWLKSFWELLGHTRC